MTYSLRIIRIILLSIIIGGCGVNEKGTDRSKGSEVAEVDKQEDNNVISNEGAKDSANDEYPLPILSGWGEEEIAFETIGNGTIDIWHGEFSFEGEIDDYFEPYQAALTEMGFEVSVTEDAEGMKSLEFTIVIDGDNHAGNALFTNHWVKSSLQHFK